MPKTYPLFNTETTSVFGGAEVDVYLTATELAKDEAFKVSCVVADYEQKETELRENVSVVKGLNFNHNQLKIAISLWKSLKEVNADIYITKTASLGVFLIYLFCRLQNKKFIYRTASQREFDSKYNRWNSLSNFLFIYSLKRADTVFCQNKTDRKLLKKDYNINSISLANAHRISSENKRSPEFILWVGRSARVKRPDRFLSLARKKPEEKFIMICQKATGDNQYDKLKDEASKINNLDFIPRVTFKEIDSYFQKALMFVNTSDSEGFPNTFIQAGKCAVPILSYKVNPDNLLNEYNCGLCADGDWNLFLDQFNKLQVDDFNSKLGNNGLEYVLKNHNIENTIKTYKNIFRKLI